jgi:hypothetical protein
MSGGRRENMTLQIVLLVVAGILLVLYIARRRARLRGEASDKN